MPAPQHPVTVEKEVQSLAGGGSPCVEQVAAKAALAPEGLPVQDGWRVDRDCTHGVGAFRGDRMHRLQEAALLLGQVPEGIGRGHRPSDGAEAQRRLVVGGGDQQSRMGRCRESPDGRMVEVRHEEGRPVGPGGERADQRRGERPLAHEPCGLGPERRRKPEHRPAHLVEEAGLPPSHHLEPPHPHRAVQVIAGGKGRRPGRLVARRGRPDLDVPSPRLEGAGQPSDQLLAPPADVRAVAGHHQAEPAPAPWGPVGRRRAASSPSLAGTVTPRPRTALPRGTSRPG